MDTDDPELRERQLWQLVARRDFDAIENCLLPDGVFIDADQVQSRNELIDGLRQISLESFEIDRVNAAHITDDLQTIVYRARESVVTSAGEVSRAVMASSTWIRRDGSWWLALHHESATS